jgi:glycosyltransferase involved in cell wall biosynthesis
MIEAYLVAFNEEETIHFSIKHYQTFCSRITILNNHSTDRTVEIAKAMGCRIRNFGTPGILNDRDYIDIKNECWKESRYDWVIVADCDEILSVPRYAHGQVGRILQGFDYAKYNGQTLFKTQGWNIFSHDVPKDNWLEITNGHPDENYSKTVIFNPKQITDINFRIGAHVSSPRGNVIWSEETLTLFHYRNVGGPQRLIERHNLYRPRMSQENLQRNWGHHYLMTDEERIKEWELKYQKSKPFSLVGV